MRMRLGKARKRKRRALQVGVRLGRARKRKGRALQVRVRLGRAQKGFASESEAWKGATGKSTGSNGLAGASKA